MSQRRNCCCCNCPPNVSPFACCPCCYETLSKNGATFTKQNDCSWKDPSGNTLKFCYGHGWTLNGNKTNAGGNCPPDGFTFCYTPNDLNLQYSITGDFRSAYAEGPSDDPSVGCIFGTVNLTGTLIIKGAPCYPGAVGCAGWQPASTGQLLVPATNCVVPPGYQCADSCHCENCPHSNCSPTTQDWGFTAFVSFTGCQCGQPETPAQFNVTIPFGCPNVTLIGQAPCDAFSGQQPLPLSWTTFINGECYNCINPTATFSIS